MRNNIIAILKILVISILIILGFYSGLILAFVLSPVIIGLMTWFTISINNNKKGA
tara:strand:+ start:207 stop:371 length:165 start_codon:yes stop_codon:yes gene_type:complete